MPGAPIDLWDDKTYDDALLSELRRASVMIRDYFMTERANYEAYNAPDNKDSLRVRPRSQADRARRLTRIMTAAA